MGAREGSYTLLYLGLRVLLVAIVLVVRAVVAYMCRSMSRRRLRVAPSAVTLAFFHPYCDAGGGGERVLWLAIKALAGLHSQGTPLHVIIYSGDQGVKGEEILARAQAHFGVDLGKSNMPISFVFVPGRSLLEAWRYPVFTMVGQSLGSVVLAALCLWSFIPDVFIDTTGCAFTYPFVRLSFACRVICYTHYPTISTDMLNMVREQRPSYNNDGRVAGSTIKTSVKLLYYHVFAWCYGLCGAFVDLAMVNSSWTRDHIRALWKLQPTVHTVFPPCDTKSLQALPLGNREPVILSVGQFRPEKDHPLQIRAFAKLLKSGDFKHVKLVLLGSCRNAEDTRRVETLKRLAKDEGVEAQVDFVVNAHFPELKGWLGRASVGLHTMWNEHFGICVVEYMAAGLIPVAHNSGGPKMDIVVPHKGAATGFLASTADEYAEVLAKIFSRNDTSGSQALADIPAKARASVQRFSDDAFMLTFSDLTMGFLTKQYFKKGQ